MCGDLRSAHAGQSVILMGWVNRRRDHGDLVFLDLRDRSGITQVVVDKSESTEALAKAEAARPEFVVAAIGTVRQRLAGLENPNMPTGDIEVVVSELLLLSDAKTPPFSPAEDAISNEELRLQYRYLDLRRPEMQANFLMRHKVAQAIRGQPSSEGFLEIETPMLTRSTPEGARDYLVPSRVHPGTFFALPQSPQLFKQLLMVAGFDRYYQITKCFRDEDLRADRQPEFTQIDIETSFMTQDQIMSVTEGMIRELFKDLKGVEFDELQRMPFSEAIAKYGSDKPDMRIPLELVDIKDLVKDVDFKVFSGPDNAEDGRVVGLRVPGGAEMSRGEIDGYTEFVKIYGAKGLAWVKVNDVAAGREGLQSPIVKNMHDRALAEILKRTGAQ